MLNSMKPMIGKVLTAKGPVDPTALGKVMMHEHLHSDCYDWDKQCLVDMEKPIDSARRELLMREAIPPLRACNEHGCHAYVDVTPPPYLHMFTHTLPAFRKMGLTAEEEDCIMRRNPQRIIPIQ
jgi:predicted metal-dependent phosphotriesterase family hydrolase